MEIPVYSGQHIGSIESLATLLTTSIEDLTNLAQNTESYYQPNRPIIKPNGKVRQTYTVKPPLKLVQKRILREILDKVSMPMYLQGSIKKDPDSGTVRDYISDACMHIGCCIIIRTDIEDFFPSIRANRIRDLWCHLFGFPEDVATLLTSLTTYRDYVPQGACTSSCLANLILWDQEPEIEDWLRRQGFRYSRFVDDITVTSSKRISHHQIALITNELYGMLDRAGFRPNHQKSKVVTGREALSVHGLNLNARKPTLGKKKRLNLRAAVKQFEDAVEAGEAQSILDAKYSSILGRITNAARLDHRYAKDENRLRAARNKAHAK